MQVIQQKPTDLVLAVLSGDLPPRLTVLDSVTVCGVDWQVTFRIIGESHAISIQHGDQPPLHEILACVDLPATTCRHYHPFTALAAHHYTHHAYTVQVRFDSAPPKHIPPDAPGIEVRFPITHGKTPITRIQWQQQGDTLHWWTLHLYPASHGMTAVHTHSHFVVHNPVLRTIKLRSELK